MPASLGGESRSSASLRGSDICPTAANTATHPHPFHDDHTLLTRRHFLSSSEFPWFDARTRACEANSRTRPRRRNSKCAVACCSCDYHHHLARPTHCVADVAASCSTQLHASMPRSPPEDGVAATVLSGTRQTISKMTHLEDEGCALCCASAERAHV